MAPILTATAAGGGPPSVKVAVATTALTVHKVQALQQEHETTMASSFHSPQEERHNRRVKERRDRLFTVAMGSIGGLAVVTAVLSMYVEASAVAYAAFFFPLVAAPYSIVQRRRINKQPAFEELVNWVRCHVNRLAEINRELHQQTSKLTAQAAKLAAAEQSLQQAVAKTGGNVQDLQRLIQENGETQRHMKNLQDAQEVQNLLTAVLQSDNSGDMVLDEGEMDELVMRLQTFSTLPMNEKRLREAFRTSDSQSTTTLFRLTSNHAAEERAALEDELQRGLESSDDEAAAMDEDFFGRSSASTYFRCLD